MTATFRGRTLLGVLTIVLSACGGQVEGDGTEPGADEQARDQDGEATSTGGGDSSGLSPGDLTLEECELGFLLAESDAPCNWLAAGRCYETKAAACECVCPLDGPSLCLSDFYGGEGSQTRVSCH